MSMVDTGNRPLANEQIPNRKTMKFCKQAVTQHRYHEAKTSAFGPCREEYVAAR